MSTDAYEDSLAWCRETTRKAATSFYYAFKTLPRRKRIGFEVVYAFMRHSDDLSDDAADAARADAIASWRDRLRRGLAGELDVHPVMPALVRVLDEFEIDPQHLFDLIDGTERDLAITRYETIEDLLGYCYLVASTVGLVSIRLFGLAEPSPENWRRAETLAVDNGYAFQLTNILRDVSEDLERDRVYLPLRDLAEHGLTIEDLRRAPGADPRFRALMAAECARAEAHYAASRPLVAMIAPDARASLRTMRRIYHGILDRIVAQDYDVFSRRARVPLTRKLGIAASAWLGIGAEV
ncbi:MAG: phytoene/squalene synthase family protein [Planctomycetota bacterium]